MAKVNVYLSFNGNCEEAFNFYKSVFGGEFNGVYRFKDMPPSDFVVPEEFKNHIMHMGLPISGETILMGSDCIELSPEQKWLQGSNFSIAVGVTSDEEAHRVFEGLSEGGNVSMPLQTTFWSPLFGVVKDRFGIEWMIDMER